MELCGLGSVSHSLTQATYFTLQCCVRYRQDRGSDYDPSCVRTIFGLLGLHHRASFRVSIPSTNQFYTQNSRIYFAYMCHPSTNAYMYLLFPPTPCPFLSLNISHDYGGGWVTQWMQVTPETRVRFLHGCIMCRVARGDKTKRSLKPAQNSFSDCNGQECQVAFL